MHRRSYLGALSQGRKRRPLEPRPQPPRQLLVTTALRSGLHTAALPSPVADADGDLEMTEASAGEVPSLTFNIIRRIINALAHVAPGAQLQLV